MKGIVSSSATRTATGDLGRSPRDRAPTDLGIVTTRAALDRAGGSAGTVEQAFCGHVIHMELRQMYLSPPTAQGAGLVLAGGAASMGRAGYMLPAARRGAKMVDMHATGGMNAALNDLFGLGHAGVSAEPGLEPARLNPNGGAAALRRPIGASGARLGGATMYLGGGQGGAPIPEAA